MPSSKQYENIITKSVQEEFYTKSDEGTVWQARYEDKKIAERLDLSDRINVTAEWEAFATLK